MLNVWEQVHCFACGAKIPSFIILLCFSDLELKPVGTLDVKLIQAKGLTNKDIVGKSDPYAVLFIRPLRDKMKNSKTIVRQLLLFFVYLSVSVTFVSTWVLIILFTTSIEQPIESNLERALWVHSWRCIHPILDSKSFWWWRASTFWIHRLCSSGVEGSWTR